MKILAIGDFHGKFPEKLEKLAKSEEINAIVALGDYANADKIRKIIFKHWTDKPWHEVVGLKKARQMEKESFDSGLKILKKLNSLGKPVFLIWGNTDFYKDYRFTESPIFMPGFYENKIKKMKNLVVIDKRKSKIGGSDIIGHGGYLDVTEYIKNPIDKDKKAQKKRLKRYKEDERRLEKLFLKKKPEKDFIFVIHYPPYGYFDKIAAKKNPMYGKHVGWQPYNEIIKKYKPSLVFCGHMHEYIGKKKLGESLVINVGAAFQGNCAIIDYPEKDKKKDIKVRLYR